MLYLHRDLTSIPVLARAGAIVPLLPEEALLDGVEVPRNVEVRVYAGADGDFTLAETTDDGRVARTRMTYDDATGEVTVHDVVGDTSVVPDDRTYTVTVVRPADDATADADQRVFAMLDAAQMSLDLKATIQDTVRAAASPAAALVSLQGLDLDAALLSALSELLVAR
jgi:hypothetical protein